jgi:riboflavin synthase
MFTGLIETVGEVVSFSDGWLELRAHFEPGDPVVLGESVAVNGCCLTAVKVGERLAFELSQETLARTSLGSLTPGRKVNLERAMRADGRFGGHVVQGHVDGVGQFLGGTPEGNSVRMRFKTEPGGGRYLIDKGSIALEGISLTVVQPVDDQFDVWVIPHTLASTGLGELSPGDAVNVEYDVLAKYVEKLLVSSGK